MVNKTEIETAVNVATEVVSLAKKVLDFFKNLKPDSTIQNLTYQEFIKILVSKKPDDDRIQAAAAVREIMPNNEGVKIIIVFLDENNQIIWNSPSGKEYSILNVAKTVDSELNDIFGEEDLVIFN